MSVLRQLPRAEDGTLPFHTFLWKVASRCNLDCTYCYVYNSVDQRWRLQPKLMSREVARQIAYRMREHLESYDKKDCLVTFHGGEAMLGGVEHLRMLASVLAEELAGSDVEYRISMQSNGTLFTTEIGDLMLEHKITTGISLDGPPEVNDRFRVDHRGRPSSAVLEEKLRLLTSDRYRKLFTGFLCVIDTESDPIEVFEYLRSWGTASVDFLFPLENWERMPPNKPKFEDTPYADWLIPIFDHWWDLGKPLKIRIFDSILRLICNVPTLVESLGLDPVDLVVVETNGEIEGVDSLKTTFEGASVLDFNVFDHGFREVAAHMAVQRRQSGVNELCEICRNCPVVEVCGGGYLPHRYSPENGFDNPSIYCRDLEKLIRHIHGRLFGNLLGAEQQGDTAILERALMRAGRDGRTGLEGISV